MKEKKIPNSMERSDNVCGTQLKLKKKKTNNTIYNHDIKMTK